MNHIFYKVARENVEEKEGQKYFKYKDFLISILYICMFTKHHSKSTRLQPVDYKNLDVNSIRTFFDFLGLKLPFNKREVENLINDRRALSVKELFRLQTNLKKQVVANLKPQKRAKSIKRIINNRKKDQSPNNNDIKDKKNNVKANNDKNSSSPNKKDDSLVEVPIDKLHDTSNNNIKVIDPSGKEEKWDVKKH
jgi:hypothetical protein